MAWHRIHGHETCIHQWKFRGAYVHHMDFCISIETVSSANARTLHVFVQLWIVTLIHFCHIHGEHLVVTTLPVRELSCRRTCILSPIIVNCLASQFAINNTEVETGLVKLIELYFWNLIRRVDWAKNGSTSLLTFDTLGRYLEVALRTLKPCDLTPIRLVGDGELIFVEGVDVWVGTHARPTLF